MNDKSVVCILDSKIIRIYKDIDSVSQDGFIPKIIKEQIKTGNTYYKCSWKFVKDVDPKEIEEYIRKDRFECNYLTDIIKCNSSGNYQCTYKYQEVEIIKKILKKDISDRLYKGSIWYRLGEYKDINPEYIEYRDTDLEDSLSIILTITDKLVSVNDLYKARVQYSHGRAFPVVYKNPKAVKISQANRNQLLALDLSQYKPWLEKTKNFAITLNFVLKSGISTRDLGNVEKQISDDLVRYIKEDLGVEHFDDSEFLEMSMNKSIIPEASKEYVFIQLKESFHNIRFDEIEKPKRLYLMSGNSEITDKFMEWIKDSDLELYIDGTDVWNPEYTEHERTEGCNMIVKILTPDLGYTAISELLDMTEDMNRCIEEDKGFIRVGIIGTASDWSDTWNTLEKCSKNLQNTYKTSRIKIKQLDINNLEDFIK